MTRRAPLRNLPASIRAKLLRVASTGHEDFNYVLTRYGIERLLYRLSRSDARDRFVLKGAMLFGAWTGSRHRATHDIDLLGTGAPDAARLAEVFRAVCKTPVEDDGICFDPATVIPTRQREGERYEGVHVALRGALGSTRLHVQVDVGFGDVITPGPVRVDVPTLLPQPRPCLSAYPKETVIAEKLHAIVALGMANSRMKDFFDIDFLARQFEFDGTMLVRAVTATFQRRCTALPERLPTAFRDVFVRDASKRTQWRAFLRKGKTLGSDDLEVVVSRVKAFAWPVLVAARDGSPLRAWSTEVGVWR